jgi:ADP-ribose pyrophosphatase
VDGVGIVAILQYPSSAEDPGKSELLLQKQYRPPIDKIVIEVPAGLVDAGESPEASALRELKEETGYVGEVLEGSFGVSPIMYNGTLSSPQEDRLRSLTLIGSRQTRASATPT